MIQINLLPVREWKRKELVRQQISIYLLTMFLIIVSIIAAFGYLETYINNKEKKKADLEKRKAELSYVEKALKESKDNQELIATKFKTIESLQLTRGNLTTMLNRLVVNVPNDRIWFEEFEYKGSSISIKGVAMDNQSVALFMKRLEFAEIFKNIALISSERKIVDQIELMNFIIQANLDFSKKESK